MLRQCFILPSWMTKRGTGLLQKDDTKGNVASNYRPITFLQLMLKLLLGGIWDQIYGNLDQQNLLPEK